MEKIEYDVEKDYMDALKELTNKINEIIDWINNQ